MMSGRMFEAVAPAPRLLIAVRQLRLSTIIASSGLRASGGVSSGAGEGRLFLAFFRLVVVLTRLPFDPFANFFGGEFVSFAIQDDCCRWIIVAHHVQDMTEEFVTGEL